MPVIDKIVALFDAIDVVEIEAMPPAQRQRFAQRCRHLAALAERGQKPEPKSGVLGKLKDGERSE
jgi:hypothetical protein